MHAACKIQKQPDAPRKWLKSLGFGQRRVSIGCIKLAAPSNTCRLKWVVLANNACFLCLYRHYPAFLIRSYLKAFLSAETPDRVEPERFYTAYTASLNNASPYSGSRGDRAGAISGGVSGRLRCFRMALMASGFVIHAIYRRRPPQQINGEF